MKSFIIISLFLICLHSNAQTFYVNTITDNNNINNTYQFSVNNCDSIDIYTCIPTEANDNNVDYHYFDIAIDSTKNFYYLSGFGRLYTRKLTDPNSCQYLGQFGDGNPNTSVIALVADVNGNLLAAGIQGAIPTLYEYQPKTKIFSTLGSLPLGFEPSGDLFFYMKGNLFMTAYNTDAFLVEITIADPSKSCYYMDLGNIAPYAALAFSIQYATYSDAYVFDTKGIEANTYLSTLYKLDLFSKTISAPTYVFTHLKLMVLQVCTVIYRQLLTVLPVHLFQSIY